MSDLLSLASQQQTAVQRIEQWYQDGSSQVFKLFGYAGTGKTTLAQHIVDRLGLEPEEVRYAAYTGKAAYVLRTKGCEDASTIHKLIYKPKGKCYERLWKLQAQLVEETDGDKRKALQREIRAEEKNLQTPDFVLREDSPLQYASLLVLDEVSMVGYRIARDLLSFNIKLLVLGDPAQLPPVEGGGYFTDTTPDYLLTEIHRSALDSPVTRIATAIRHSTSYDRTLGVPGADGDSGRTSFRSLLDFDQIITFKRHDRRQLVDVVRALQGRSGLLPQPGDQIIVLANNPDYGVYNGQEFTVTECEPHPKRDDVLCIQVSDDNENTEQSLDVLKMGFIDVQSERAVARLNKGRGGPVAATFGQVTTCHKAQGSQWNRVLVFDQSAAFSGMTYHMKVEGLGHEEAAMVAAEARRQWLYTAVTRAARQVVILGGSR